MDSNPDAAAAISAAARTLSAPVTLEETLDTIVSVAQRSLPGVDHVGISLAHRDGRMETLAGTDPLVWRLDEVQYRTGEGPCVHAMQGHGVVEVSHAVSDTRWPTFMAAAVAAGMRSQLGIQLFRADDRPLGGLNMYSVSRDVLPADTVHLAELFATHAALALDRAMERENLTTALSTRKVIGQAVGILMERYQLDEDRAFGFLTRTSQTSNIKLRELAQELVDTANDRGTPQEL